MIDVDEWIERLMGGQLLSANEVELLCSKVTEVLAGEPNVRSVLSPVTIVGDVHGQFFDLLELFSVAGPCPSTNYVFLGDYVDRGHHSVEVITLLFCLKLRYPDRVTLVRGNHESRSISTVYGFYAECMRKYDGNVVVWKYVTDVFDYLCLAAVVEDAKILCVHGGLSPTAPNLDSLDYINRFQELPPEGTLSDLVWSDPDPTGAVKGFGVSPRGAGYLFGEEVVKAFLWENDLDCIVRAHQLCMSGYQILFNESLFTVWSAPNYCYRCGNVASVLEVNGQEKFFNVFDAAPDQMRGGSGGEEKKEEKGKALPDYFL
mmetsp:Transcript_34129/g.88085  ORF Transcript_34129/g.88085 Transcript_34129/m.88085 type:complete len:317 (-) Transcript_34129:1390-2340(-)